MNLTAKNIDYDLKERAKDIVKESGVQWEYYITKSMEKILAETLDNRSVEKIITGGNSEKVRKHQRN